MKRMIQTHGIAGTLGIVAASALAYLLAAVTPRTAATEETRKYLRMLWR